VRNVPRALSAAFVQHWLDSARLDEVTYVVVGQIAIVGVFAWLARLGGQVDVISTIAFGVVLMVMWRSSVFRLGFLVVGANNQGTLEIEMMSRTPMFWIMLGKTLAAFAFYGLIGIACFVVVVLIGGAGVVIGDPVALVASLVVALIASISLAYVFAPLTFLAGGQAGFFNAIMPLGIVLSGFAQPIAILPGALQIAARALPTSWATEALLNGLRGAPIAELLPLWGVSLLLSLGVFLLSAWMFVRCEARVREVGSSQ